MHSHRTRKPRRHKPTKLYTRKKKKHGGKAIDAGTYGCVFSPILKCNNNNNNNKSSKSNNSDFVSKLMMNEYANVEMNEIENVKSIVTQIPNNDKYFLISNTELCKPGKLSSEDLIEFDTKCSNIVKNNITSNNINSKLDELSIISMPNGGVTMETYWKNVLENKNKYGFFIKTNTQLISLLKNAIVPLNKLGMNHFDIKDGNVLFSTDGFPRLIDWGLSSKNDGKTIPETLLNRSVAFNMPFSNLFFNDFIKEILFSELKHIKNSDKLLRKSAGQKELLKMVAINIINKLFEKLGNGHFELITSIFLHTIYKIYANDNGYREIDYNSLTTNVIVEYIQTVLIHYVDENGNFDDKKYYYNIFVKNADIWGFIMVYIPIIEHGIEVFNKELINGLCRIFLKYCFSPEYAVKVIDISELENDLLSLNSIALSLNSIAASSNIKKK